MPEAGEGNIEFAHELSHGHDHAGPHVARERWHTIVEVLEVILLAIVAVSTAYSGFQAAKWDAEEAHHYGESSTLYTNAATERTAGVQVLAADAATFTAWLQARYDHQPQLQEDLLHRLSPAYRVAFDAWLETDPFTNNAAPIGPAAMPNYHNPLTAQADEPPRKPIESSPPVTTQHTRPRTTSATPCCSRWCCSSSRWHNASRDARRASR